jgi:hypothetical protein
LYTYKVFFEDVVTELKVAVTFLAVLIVTTQVPVPLQAPLQPEKLLPASGVAVSVTVVADVN